mgnify:CR=1 FL=1
MIIQENIPIVLKNYFELKDSINNQNLVILNDIFEKINKYKLESTNVLYNNLIVDGLVMKICNKQKNNNLDDSLYNILLKNVNDKINRLTNPNEIYYYNTFINLIKNFNYITIKEQVLLNFLFEEITFENRKLQEVNGNEKKYIIK